VVGRVGNERAVSGFGYRRRSWQDRVGRLDVVCIFQL
jgi:hypothetical protein